MPGMNTPSTAGAHVLTAISSMATRAVLAELATGFEARHGVAVVIESVGGVDAARRVAAGEPFDLVLLADCTAARSAASLPTSGSGAPAGTATATGECT